MSGFTHFDAQGNAIMVDVTDKDITEMCHGKWLYPGEP